MLRRAEMRFSGKVQGVYFRDFTRRWAKELGLRGWVMNLPDGSVSAVFEGEEDDIIEVLRRLREEHPIAVVESVDLEWKDPRGVLRDFQVRYLE